MLFLCSNCLAVAKQRRDPWNNVVLGDCSVKRMYFYPLGLHDSLISWWRNK
jgi:hypothetical protein